MLDHLCDITGLTTRNSWTSDWSRGAAQIKVVTASTIPSSQNLTLSKKKY